MAEDPTLPFELQESSAPDRSAGLRRLLLVEDEPADVAHVRAHLRKLREAVPETDVAGTLGEALRSLAVGGYDAVLLDLNLPDSRGFDTLDRILASGTTAPVVVLTSESGEKGVGAVARGAADFLPKEELTGRLLLRSLRYAVERGHRHRAQDSAARITTRLERTLAALEDAVFTIEFRGRTILSCNPAAESIFGYPPMELVGSSTRILHRDHESWARIGDLCREALDRGEAYRGEHEMRRRNGAFFPAEITVTPMDPRVGAGGGVVTVIRDITEAVERSRQVRFQSALLEQVGQPVLAVDAHARVTYWNRAAADLTGFAAEEVLGQEILGLIVHEGDRSEALLAREAGRAGGRWEGELRLRTKDGKQAVVSATTTPAVNPDGTPGGRIAAGTDVTRLREAEEESRKAAERLRFQAEMLEAVGQAVIATDLDGRIVYWNHAAEQLYGWQRDEVMGRPVLEVTPSRHATEARQIMKALQKGDTWSGEIELRRHDGSTFHALVTDAPIFDDEGGLIGIVGVSSDVRERRELEDRLRAQKMEAIGRLAGGIAHDFNNLLTAVEGRASLLLADLPQESPLREDAEAILLAGRRAADLTSRLLAFSRKQMLRERNVDLCEVAAELRTMLERIVPERIDLRFEAPPSPIVVRADPGQLNQVVMNLVVNAVDAIAESGRIEVRVDEIDLSYEESEAIPWEIEPGSYARLTVEDTGSGITPAVVERMFEPFFTTKPEGQGTGLGLSTVYGIIKQSGGHVIVDTEPGRGSSFRVLLPRIRGAAEGLPQVAPLTAPPVEGAVVLLVEDDAVVRDVARRVLTRGGYTVIEASNGREAIEVAQRTEGRIDIAISDVVMPEMGGVELQKRLRELYPGLRMVLSSGYSEAELQGEIRQHGSSFLPKPFTPEGLLQRIAESLRGGS